MRVATKRELFLVLILVGSLVLLYPQFFPERERTPFYSATASWCNGPKQKPWSAALAADVEKHELLATLAGAAQEQDVRRVLFLGNSHTYVHKIPNLVRRLATLAGKRVETYSLAYAGYGLPDHWNDAVARAAIRSGLLTDVILQGQSGRSIHCSKELADTAGFFASEARAFGVSPLLYMVWVRDDYLSGQEPWTVSYLLARDAHRIPVAPVGLVWQRIERALDKRLFRQRDGNHATKVGAFVSAFTITLRLFADLSAASLFESVQDKAPRLLEAYSMSQDQFAQFVPMIKQVLYDEPNLDPLAVRPEGGLGLPFLGAVYYQHGHTELAISLWEKHLSISDIDSEAVRSMLKKARQSIRKR